MEMSALNDIFTRGGPVMPLLAFCSIIALAVILERLIFWFAETRKVRKGKLKHAHQLLKLGARADALKLISESDDFYFSRLPRNLKPQFARSVFDVELAEVEERATKYLPILNTVVVVSPLLGILGTVIGIIDSFSVLEEAIVTDPSLVGNGLAEALLTTAFGLGIAVPCVVVLSYFNRRAEKHLMGLQHFAEELALALSVESEVKAAA